MRDPQKASIFKLVSLVRRWGGPAILLGLSLAIIAGAAVYGFYRQELPMVMAAKDYRPIIKSQVYAENGELVAEFGTHQRIVVSKDWVPPLLAKAFVAAEDKHFYSHHGIDFLGILSALFEKVTNQRANLRGASTITQQLAKSLLIKSQGYDNATARTLSRKIKEAMLAIKLESRLTKDEILWMYLNEVFLGHGSYGVAAAARTYFHKTLKELSLGQMAILAGLPQAPTRLSPQSNLPACLSRQGYVLNRMLEDGFISQEEHDAAIKDNQHLQVFGPDNLFRKVAPYFAEQVRRTLIEQYGEKALYEEGLQIYTTLDADRAEAMQRVLKSGIMSTDRRQGFNGPVFRPATVAEQALAKDAVARINQTPELSLPSPYALAQVNQIDLDNQAVYLDLGSSDGVIPLAGMWWARTPNPEHSYDGHKLTSIKGVVQNGDVVLVKKSSIDSLKKDNVNNRYGELLDALVKNRGGKKQVFYSLEQEPVVEGAMIAIEQNSGYINAMEGGYSFDRSEFNRALQACRQPGSLFKPVVYSAAIAQKSYTPATLVLDAPLTFRDIAHETSWKPQNFGQKYLGEVTVHEAVMRSMNVPALNVAADVGINNVIAWAHNLGIESSLKPELGTGIGASCVTMWELARAYLAIANMGKVVEPIFIKKIVNRDGEVLFALSSADDPWTPRTARVKQSMADFFQKESRVMSEEDAYTMHYLLTEVAKIGTAQRTQSLNRPMAGKTGTTNDSFDAWFAGYTKNLLAISWLGYDTMQTHLGVYEQGSHTALPLFVDFMTSAQKSLPKQDWPLPATMCQARIDAKTGLRVESELPDSFVAPFRCGQEPGLLKDSKPKGLEQLERL